MNEIKTELTWKSCKDNPPTRTSQYILITKNKFNENLYINYATYSTVLDEWWDDHCITIGKEGLWKQNEIPYIWSEVNIPNLMILE